MGASVLTQNILKSYVRGIFQVGIGEVGEEQHWDAADIQHKIYVEPLPEYYTRLLERVGITANVRCFNVALANVNEIKPFYICNAGDSSSLYPISENIPLVVNWMVTPTSVPIVVKTIDTLVQENNIDLSQFNLLYMDTQGSEYEIVEGAKDSLRFFDIVVAEIFLVAIYAGPKLFDVWIPFMEQRGFRLKARYDFPDGFVTDAVFVRIGSAWDKEGV